MHSRFFGVNILRDFFFCSREKKKRSQCSVPNKFHICIGSGIELLYPHGNVTLKVLSESVLYVRNCDCP